MDSTYNFKFSLFANDYVRIVNKKDEIIEGYYRAFCRATANIQEIISHDNSQKFISLGIKTLKNFEKQNTVALFVR